MENYYGVQGLDDLAAYFEKRAEEEMNHHQWIFEYLTDADFEFDYPVIEKNNLTFKNVVEPFQRTVEREIETTQMLYAIYKAAKEEGDYMTAIWLERPLILEQIEEENTSRTALDIIETDTDIYEKSEKILKLLEE